MDQILLAVDGSDHSMRAAVFAGELSFEFGHNRVARSRHRPVRRGQPSRLHRDGPSWSQRHEGFLLESVSHKVGHLTETTPITVQ
jgi:hypothetical protein